MKNVKSCLIITMLLGVGYADCDPELYNCDCNEDTWQEYYNSKGHNMLGCWLPGGNLWGQTFQTQTLLMHTAGGHFLLGLI